MRLPTTLPRPADPARAGAFAALVAVATAYYAIYPHVPGFPSRWWDVAFVGLVVAPMMFGLVLLALPVREHRLLPAGVLALVAAAVVVDVADLGTPATFLKLAAVAGLGFFVLRFFEHVTWVVLVALLIVPIDIISVQRGPTKVIIEDRPEVFDHLSVSFPVPGGDGAAQLGLPDVLFLSLFLAATDRFGLRTRLSWVLMVASFGGTMAIVQASDGAIQGWAALPLLSAGFVLANVDLLWRAAREQLASLRRP